MEVLEGVMASKMTDAFEPTSKIDEVNSIFLLCFTKSSCQNTTEESSYNRKDFQELLREFDQLLRILLC